MTCSTVIEGLEALVDDLNSADFVIEPSLTQGQVKDEVKASQGQVKDEVKDNFPSTLADAGALLPVKVSGTTVKTRLLLIASECFIPLEYLAVQEGNRLTGITRLGWLILKDMPHEKGKAREEYFDSVDTRFAEYLPSAVPLSDSELVEEPDEEISSADFAAIVQRKVDSLSIPVTESVSIAPIINFPDFEQMQALSYLAGKQMGIRIGAQVAAGINDGIRQAQEGLRGEMIQSLEGVE